MVSFWCYLRLEFHYKEVLQNLSRTTCTFVSSKLPGKTSSGTDPRRPEYRRIQIPKVPTPDVLSFVFRLCLFHHFFSKELQFLPKVRQEGIELSGLLTLESLGEHELSVHVEDREAGKLKERKLRNEICSCFPRLETMIRL